MLKRDFHVFQGMRRDNHPIRQESKFLWEAHNIRFTAREDNTLLAMTNERGPKKQLDTEGNEVSFMGSYVGHCVVGDYLVVFVQEVKSKVNIVYRLKRVEEGVWEVKELTGGYFNMSPDHPLQTLGLYEGEFVQKVYWVDGINQPRVINVTEGLLRKSLGEIESEDDFIYPEGSLDFVRELSLYEKVVIERQDGEGTFSPGTIQYAFSYYNRYGQESNLFYTTPLYHISYKERGGSPEDKISNVFIIKLYNVQQDFDFIRVYSIHRTSLDATPSVKVVSDIKINDVTNSYLFVDTGTTGYDIDPTKLLYVGGESIIANTLASKDNTLFLGNIEIEKFAIDSTIKTKLRDTSDNVSSVTLDKRSVNLDLNESTYYPYSNQLSKDTSTFKIGDYYRLGIQFQYKDGKWSEPCWIGDKQIKNTYNITIDEKIYTNNSRPTIDTLTGVLKLPYLKYKLDSDIAASLSSLGYKKYRGVIVLPSIRDRMVEAQGVICPTVFSIQQRKRSSPYAQSSWFFRPIGDNTTVPDADAEGGASIAYNYLDPIGSVATKETINDYTVWTPTYPRRCEIQNAEYVEFKDANTLAKNGDALPNTFYVDTSILTFHSPEIEFDTETSTALDNNQYDLQIVGLTPIVRDLADISITTSSTVPVSTDTGANTRQYISSNNSNLRLCASPLYKSHMIDEDSNAKSFYPKKQNKLEWEMNWLVYPWQRTGSLNNDITREADKGTRTSVLKRKVLSNLLVSEDNIWLDNIWSSSGTHNSIEYTGITPVNIFSSNEVSLSKIKTPLNTNVTIPYNYYGNVDTLVTTTQEYSHIITPNKGVSIDYDTSTSFTFNSFTDIESSVTAATLYNDKDPFITSQFYNLYKYFGEYSSAEIGDYAELLARCKDPVRLKYKSTPHAVFGFNYIENNNSSPILPFVRYVNSKGETVSVGKNTKEVTPYWIEDTGSDIDLSGAVEINKEYHFEDQDYLMDIDSIEERKQIIINLLNQVAVSSSTEEGTTLLSHCPWYPTNKELACLYKYTNGTWTFLEFNDAPELVKSTIEEVTSYWKLSPQIKTSTRYPDLYYLKKLNTSYIWKIEQDYIDLGTDRKSSTLPPFLYLAELVKKEKPDNMFNGDTDEALQNNLWIPAGNPSALTEEVQFTFGDTYYQRYDCLKTYPFTTEDENSVVEIASFMCETRVNIDGRYDRNRGQISNLNMSPTNFNLINPAYSQRNNFFNYRILDKSFYTTVKYPSQIIWSTEKTNLEDVDSWTNITLANSKDLEGNNGKLVSLESFNELLVAFQEKSINQVLFNSRVQIPTSDGVPVEISNNYKLEGVRVLSDTIGCQDKASITKSPLGIYFIDSNTDILYIYNGEIKNLSDNLGARWWLKSYHTDTTWNVNNFTNTTANSVRLSYDSNNKDLYISPSLDVDNTDALCYSEQLGQFTSMMSYSQVVLVPYKNIFLSLQGSPDKYILWENFKGDYNYFYGFWKMPDFTYISNEDAAYTKIFDTIEYRADMYEEGTLNHTKSFDWVQVYNEYQDTDVKQLTQSRTVYDKVSLRKKFRVWRSQLPRQGRERIRNPWAAITLGFNVSDSAELNKFNFVLHDISTQYTI